MPKKKSEERTRQIYAAIREDLYLAAKSRATEMRMPLREFIEHALELALAGRQDDVPSAAPSVWEDEYIDMQLQQPVGSPVQLDRENAERVVRGVYGSRPRREPDGEAE